MVSVTARDDWVSVGGLRFHYRRWGRRRVAPIVLLHGLASTCHIWDLVAPLLARNFAVVALDQRGHGETDKPESGYDFATVARDLERVLEALKLDRPLLVGHSWGGNVAVEYASTYPTAPRGLCLIDGGTIEISAASEMTLERAREEMAPPDFTGLTLDQLKEMARTRDFGFELTPQVMESMLANFDIGKDGAVRARFPRRHHMAVIDAFWSHRPSALFGNIRCPVLLLPTRREHSEDSKERLLHKEESIAVAARTLRLSKTVWFEDSVHDVPLQRPEEVARVIDEHIRNGFFEQR